MEHPALERSGPDPLYRQIKRWIQEQLTAGRWPEHCKLPAEEDLAEALGVNRGTLRRAIREFISEGILVQIHGKGTFVASRGIEQPLAERLVAFSESLAERGIAYTTQVLQQAAGLPSPTIASRLRLSPEQPVLSLARLRLVEGAPVAYMENHVPLHLTPGIDQVSFDRHGLFETLEQKYKLHLAWGQRVFEAVAASAQMAGHLAMAPGAPVFYIKQTVYLSDGTPVEYSDVWLRGDKFSLSAVVHRTAQRRHPLSSGAPDQKLSF